MYLDVLGDRICIMDEHRDGFLKDALTSNIPHLQRHIDILRKLHSLQEEIETCCLFVTLGEIIVHESIDERCFSNCSIAEHDYFVL